MELANSSAVVTGAASGLGAATAAALTARGTSVIGVDLARSIEDAEPLDGVRYVAADVTNGDEVRAAVAVAADTGPLRLVVNCAGIAPSARILGRKGVHDLALFADVVRINLVGTFTVMALAAERMAEAEPGPFGQRGVVVNTASIAAFDGQTGQAAYASSKGGVVGLTLAAARDLAQYGIRVMTLAPGIVETPMMTSFPQEVRDNLAAGVPFPARLARPDEYADLVLSVVQNDYLNGEVIRMDGALRMSPR